MNKHIYVSCLTGEIAETHAQAMELFRAGHDIDICRMIDGEWTVVCGWTHE